MLPVAGGTVENEGCRVSSSPVRGAAMRGVAIILIAAVFGAGASAQPRVVEKPRFGIESNLDLYPQNTAKAAFDSAIKLLENKRYDYFLAHVLDPELLQAKILDRAQKLEAEVEADLVKRRDEQRLHPEKVNTRDKLSFQPQEFAASVRDEAVARSFKYVVRDLQTQLGEYPENLKIFRKLQSEGQVADSGTAAVFTHKDIPGKGVYLKTNGKRWYLEDKQVDDAKPTTEK